jgi:hypothetical protein
VLVPYTIGIFENSLAVEIAVVDFAVPRIKGNSISTASELLS